MFTPIQFMQTWLQVCVQAQANTQAFHQAVHTIQNQRLRAMQIWWGNAPSHLQTMMQNLTQSAAPSIDYAWRWYAQTLQQSITLACDTTATRAHLVKTWQRAAMLPATPTGATTSLSKPTPQSGVFIALPPTVLGQPHFGSPQLKGTFISAQAITQTQQTEPTMPTRTRTPLPRISIPQLTRVQGKVNPTTKATNALRQPIEQAVQQASTMEAQQPHTATNVLPFPAPIASSTKESFARNSSRAASLNVRKGVGSRLTRGRSR